MYYDDEYGISEDDLKTQFHIDLDEKIDEEVEKRLEECVKDIDILREKQKEYNVLKAKIEFELKEEKDKKHVAENLRYRAENEKDKTIRECENKISDAYKAKIDDIFKDVIGKEYVYYIEKSESYVWCPYCQSGKVNIKLPNGKNAITDCEVCHGNTESYYRYNKNSIKPHTYAFKYFGEKLKPCLIDYGWSKGISTIPLEDIIIGYDEAETKAKELTAKSEEKASNWFKERKASLDKQ